MPAVPAATQPEPIFLISAPRSGSSWMRNLLGLHPAIATGDETYVFEAIAHLLATIERRTARHQGLLARGYLDRPGLYAACAQFFRTAVASRVSGQPYFLEKTPLNTDLMDVIHAVFPSARVVHLIRDGRAVAYSMLVGHTKGMYLPDTVQGCAERWGRIEQVIRFGGEHPQLYCELRYEDALADLRAALGRVFTFLDLPFGDAEWAAMRAAAPEAVHPSAASATEGYLDKWRASFTADDIAAFKATAGRLLVDLGYERDDRW